MQKIQHAEVKFGYRMVPPGTSGWPIWGGVNVLVVSTLQTLMVGAHDNGLQTNMPEPLAQGADNGIRHLLPRTPSAGLPLCQNSTPKGHWDMGTIPSDLLQDCSHGIIRCIGAEHKSFVRIDKE